MKRELTDKDLLNLTKEQAEEVYCQGRVIEDIEKSTVVTTEHTIHSHYCPRCKKRVEPRVSDSFEGTLVCDVLGAYNKVLVGAWQRCLAHLLRELKKVRETNKTDEWIAFDKKLRRILKEGIRRVSI